MKPLILKLKLILVLSVFCLSTPLLIRGQGFVYLSNTNQSVTSSSANITLEAYFVTGTNPFGYMLNAVTVLFPDNALNSTMARLFGPSTSTSFQDVVTISNAGFYTYTPNLPLILVANTSYAIGIYVVDPLEGMNLSYTDSSTVTSIDNWNVPGLGTSEIPLFAITATPISPVPEPSTISLACTSIIILVAFWIKQRGLKKLKS